MNPSPSPLPASPLTSSSPSANHSAMNPDESLWENLKKQARVLENEIDNKLIAFSKLASAGAGHSSYGINEATTTELEELLRKLTHTIEIMNNYLKDSGPKANPSMIHALQRHRDILYDYNKEFKKTKSNVLMSKEHAELLSGGRADAGEFKPTERSDFLLSERNHIDRSHTLADQVIQTAFEAKGSLSAQRTTFTGTSNKVAGIAGKTPVLNSLMNRIQMRKRRDMLILGAVTAICIILLFLYISS